MQVFPRLGSPKVIIIILITLYLLAVDNIGMRNLLSRESRIDPPYEACLYVESFTISARTR